MGEIEGLSSPERRMHANRRKRRIGPVGFCNTAVYHRFGALDVQSQPFSRRSGIVGSDHATLQIILAGDIFYEQDTAARAFAFLTDHARAGATIFIGDPGRTFLPKAKLVRLAEYRVSVTRDLEDAEIKHTAVWTISPDSL